MDTLTVHHFLRYLPPKIREGRTETHWKAYHFCIAVKEGKLGENSRFSVKDKAGKPVEITAKNAHECRPIFGSYLSAIANKECGGAAIVIPVPSKDSLEAGCAGRAWHMVQAACASQANLTPLDALRFTKEIQKASKGGTRNAKELYEALKVMVPRQQGKVLLVDDLFTSGAHMKAALARLTEAGFDVRCAAVCGLVVQDAELDAKVSGTVDLATSLEEPQFEDIFGRLQNW